MCPCWRFGFLAVLLQAVLCISDAFDASQLVLQLQENEFDEFISSIDVTAVYFKPADAPADAEFFGRLIVASSILTSAGIKIGQISCTKESSIKYCQQLNRGEIFAFRNGMQKIKLPPVKTLTNSAIVATILHLKLIREVPVIQTLEERYELENELRGQKDIVFIHLKRLLTSGHAFALQLALEFDDYKVALTTNKKPTMGLQTGHTKNGDDPNGGFEDDEDEAVKAEGVWILKCKDQNIKDSDERCESIHYGGDLQDEAFRLFFTRVNQPLYNEVKWSKELKGMITSKNLDLDTVDNIVYLVYNSKCKEKVVETAKFIGKKMLGLIEVLILNMEEMPDEVFDAINLERTSLVPPAIVFVHSNEMSAISNDYDDAYEFVKQRYNEETQSESAKQERNDFIDKGICNFELHLDGPLQQDDMIAQKVIAMGEPDLSRITVLNGQNMQEELQKRKIGLVLYHVKWDHLSKASIHIMAQVADYASKHNLFKDPVMIIECFDWNDICENDEVFNYPTIKIVRSGHEPKTYDGMMDVEEIIRALFLNALNAPMALEDDVDISKFLDGSLVAYQKATAKSYILGAFHDGSSEEYAQFVNSAEKLHGEVMTAACVGETAKKLGKNLGVQVPFLVISRPNDDFKPRTIVNAGDVLDDMTKFLSDGNKYVLDELKSNNFQHYNLQNTSLVILYVDEEDEDKEVVGKLAAQMPGFNFVWMKRSSEIAQTTLKAHGLENHGKNLLAVLSRAQSSFYVYDGKMQEESLRSWLQGLPESSVLTKKLLKKEWKPLVEPYNYLKMMEEENFLEDLRASSDQMIGEKPVKGANVVDALPKVTASTVARGAAQRHTEL